MLARTFAFCPLQVLAHSPFSIPTLCLVQSASGSAPSAAAVSSLTCFTSARVPFHCPWLLSAAPQEFLPKQDSLPCPSEASPSHPTPSQGSAGLLQTFGVPELRDHVQQLLRSWKPALRMQTDARGDGKSSMNIGSSCYEQRQPRHPISCSLRYHQPFRLVKLMHKYLLWCTTVTSCAFMRMQI